MRALLLAPGWGGKIRIRSGVVIETTNCIYFILFYKPRCNIIVKEFTIEIMSTGVAGKNILLF